MIRYLYILSMTLAMLPIDVYAQIDPTPFADSGTTDATITYAPQFPKPQDTVTVSVQGGSDIASHVITWSVNNKKTLSALGATTLTVPAGVFGTQTRVSAIVSGTDINLSTVISPTVVDLLVDSSSFVPNYYRGRALPSTESTIYIQATPYITSSTGDKINPQSLVYTWQKNNTVLGSQSGVGKQVLRLPGPHLDDAYTIHVRVSSTDGTRVSESSVVIPITTPVLQTYIYNPRAGVMLGNALTGQVRIQDVASTLYAIPFFTDISTITDSRVHYAWSINTHSVPTPAVANTLGLDAQGSSGSADIGLTVTHARDFLLNMESLLHVSASTQALASPGGTVTQDVFHTTKTK